MTFALDDISGGGGKVFGGEAGSRKVARDQKAKRLLFFFIDFHFFEWRGSQSW